MADLVHLVPIGVSPAEVFAALTTDKGLKGWWTAEAQAEPKEGGLAQLWFDEGEVLFNMRIATFEPAKRVVWTCQSEVEEWDGTRLEWELEGDEEGGTLVRLTHSGWDAVDDYTRMCNTTWGALMFVLKEYCETGNVEPWFTG